MINDGLFGAYITFFDTKNRVIEKNHAERVKTNKEKLSTLRDCASTDNAHFGVKNIDIAPDSTYFWDINAE